MRLWESAQTTGLRYLALTSRDGRRDFIVAYTMHRGGEVVWTQWLKHNLMPGQHETVERWLTATKRVDNRVVTLKMRPTAFPDQYDLRGYHR